MPQGGISFSHPADLSAVSNQNRMKLRVNRVAIVQELKAEHVIGYLRRNNVLTHADLTLICNTQPSKLNPVAVLLDVLANKENRTKWYNHFIAALREADVDKETKCRYRRLVDFMENTIIRCPPQPDRSGPAKERAVKYPRYSTLPAIRPKNDTVPMETTLKDKKNPSALPANTVRGTSENARARVVVPHGTTVTPHSTTVTPHGTTVTPHKTVGWHDANISQTDDKNIHVNNHDHSHSEKTPKFILISGHYHKWLPSPEQSETKLLEQSNLLISLEVANDKDFHEQISAEKLALHKMKELEVLYTLHREKSLPLGFVLCMADCFIEILHDTENYHLYVKHFLHLKQNYNLPLARELVNSFSNWLLATKLGDVQTNADLLNRTTTYGYNLFDLLEEMGEYACAELVISVLTMWLIAQPCIETWVHGYTACVRLSRIRIQNYEFQGADEALNSALKYLNAIQLMSFGKNLVDESERMVATSWLMYELGHHVTAYCWAQDSMKEVRLENKRGIVHALCNATKCYATKYNIKRAHELAIEAVRQASDFFGRAHPLFVKARLTYIEFITEFAPPNEKIVRIAVDTLKRCELVYNCDSMLLARAHLALSKAYICANKLTDNAFIEHATKAQTTAMNCATGTHPILAIFAEQLARCWLIKSRIVPKPVPSVQALAAITETNINYAKSELEVAYRICCPCFGTNSYRAAKVRVLMGDVLKEDGSLEDAKLMYEEALSTFEYNLAKSSPYTGQMRVKMAAFYYSTGNVIQSLEVMDTVLKSIIKDGRIETGPVRVHWIEQGMQTYVLALTDLHDHQRLQTAQSLRESWLERTSHITPLTLNELDKKATNYKDFIDGFNLWQKRVTEKILAEMKEERNARTISSGIIDEDEQVDS